MNPSAAEFSSRTLTSNPSSTNFLLQTAEHILSPSYLNKETSAAERPGGHECDPIEWCWIMDGTCIKERGNID